MPMKYTCILSLILISILFFSCDNFLTDTVDDFGETTYTESSEDWDGWTLESHSDEADADYEQLFDSNTTTVHRIDITIDYEYYEMMEEDMESLYGDFGEVGGMTIVDDDPIFVPVTLEFNDQTWWYVAMRYKGNSSLRDSWQNGNHKLPFRLNFDYYEDEYPSIEGQRFWGFEKMTFSNGKNDETLIRDVLASETFLAAGIEAARATFCRVYIDVTDDDEDAVYWGLYAMIEDPSDQMLDEQFGNDSGNLYKPDDETNSTLDADDYEEEYYDKANNEDEADWSDIKDFIDAIEDEQRPEVTVSFGPGSSGSSTDTTELLTHDNADWQDEIETLFDVDKFLSYLAVNNTVQNWDVYGEKAHNYYLYADPDDSDRFTWFPWDMNESFTSSYMCQDIDVESDYENGYFSGWPLLENIVGQLTYRELYVEKVAEYFDPDGTVSPVLSETTLDGWIATYSDLVAEYVLAETEGYTWLDDDFDSGDYASAVYELTTQVSSRLEEADDYIDEQQSEG